MQECDRLLTTNLFVILNDTPFQSGQESIKSGYHLGTNLWPFSVRHHSLCSNSFSNHIATSDGIAAPALPILPIIKPINNKIKLASPHSVACGLERNKYPEFELSTSQHGSLRNFLKIVWARIEKLSEQTMSVADRMYIDLLSNIVLIEAQQRKFLANLFY